MCMEDGMGWDGRGVLSVSQSGCVANIDRLPPLAPRRHVFSSHTSFPSPTTAYLVLRAAQGCRGDGVYPNKPGTEARLHFEQVTSWLHCCQLARGAIHSMIGGNWSERRRGDWPCKHTQRPRKLGIVPETVVLWRNCTNHNITSESLTTFSLSITSWLGSWTPEVEHRPANEGPDFFPLSWILQIYSWGFDHWVMHAKLRLNKSMDYLRPDWP